MSGIHKHPTISFRVSDREREMIEAKILASGMQKKDYFVHSCIYNRTCVVGKKAVIYQLVEEPLVDLGYVVDIAEYEDKSLRTGKTTGTAGGNTYC